MVTAPERTYGTIRDAVTGRWTDHPDRRNAIEAWLVAATAVLAYAALQVALMVGAAALAVYAGALVPGVAGGVVFLTLGLVVVAAAPVAARTLFARVRAAVSAHRPETTGDAVRPRREGRWR